ncbi:DHA2 family efflux MFS transporter permease subunit [Carboxydothermus pertinax]|uniref:MFS transporter n=1 Tax=Carboxydothermus pertinax TaxID=870242 RepID=A0A1L8CSH5_9THEO|nr:DHA2 family efflux MFS transporter permease subunit [Carboxydothermus pertinax]GAV21871.1 MFS transporter [Carboxydothermus pertinax]
MEHERHNFGENKWLTMFVVVIGTFMAILDTSIVNIAIPKMMQVFAVGTEEIQWVLTGYMLVMGVVIPVTGYLGDTYGYKRLYIAALFFFTLGSALCGFAWSNNSMIAARVVQAIGGGMMMPASMTIIFNTFPREERGMALGIWGISVMVAPAIGPTLSGYLVEYFNWRLIFTINIPIGLFGMVMAVLFLKESVRRPHANFDFPGFITSAVGFFALLLALSKGTDWGWSSTKILFLFWLSALSLTLFTYFELKSPEPLLDLSVLKNPTFSMSLIITMINTMGLFGGLFLFPIFFENLRGYPPMDTGLIMLPAALASGLVMPIAGRLFDRLGAKPVVLFGLTLAVLSSFGLARININTELWWLQTLLIIRAMGIGFSMMPVNTAGMNALPTYQVGRASAINNTLRQVSSSLGVAIITTITQQRVAFHGARMAEGLNQFSPLFQQTINFIKTGLEGIGVSPLASVKGAYGVIAMRLYQVAYAKAIADAVFVTALIMILGFFLTFFLKEERNIQPGEKEKLPVAEF